MTNPGSDFALISHVARTVVELGDMDNLLRFRLPYPRVAQRTFDRIVLMCLLDDADPPASMLELIRWCHARPLLTWPLDLSSEVFTEDCLLLDPISGAPTELCGELAQLAGSPTPLNPASAALGSLQFDYDRPEFQDDYCRFRRLLNDAPVLRDEMLTDPRFGEIGPFDALLKSFYQVVSSRYRDRRAFVSCHECGNLMMPTEDASWWCERDECRQISRPVGRIWYEGDRIQQLSRFHRQFITGPARTTLRLLTHPRIAVTSGRSAVLWPERGRHDLRFGSGILVRVVDWHNPALLGMAIRQRPSPETTFVVPDYRIHQIPGYLATVTKFSDGSARLVSESGLLDQILGGGHA